VVRRIPFAQPTAVQIAVMWITLIIHLLSARRRAVAAKQYQPSRVRLLLVAQAPPDADDRYFYFLDVAQHDWLFRAVARAILPRVEPTRTNKASLLAHCATAESS
jgi:hypothetical protein